MLSKMSHKRSVIVQLSLLLMLTVIGGAASATPCMSVNNQPGLCVTFAECPTFLRILQAQKIRAADIRLLQKYTCEFNVPKVCCPYYQTIQRPTPPPLISYPSANSNPYAPATVAVKNSDTVSFNLKPAVYSTETTTTSTTKAPIDLPVFAISSQVTEEASPDWQGFLSEEEISASEPTTPVVASAFSFKNHPNFKYLPTLEECGNVRSEDHIVGGHEAAHGGHPWMARIGYRNTDTNEIEFYCSGTVISKRYIVTAAHCSEEIDPEFIPEIIRLGEHNTTTDLDCSALGCSTTQDYVIEKIIAHPRYSTDDKFNDIGIIRVNRDIDFSSDYIRPICLPFKMEYGVDKFFPSVLSGRKGIVAGWGRTKWNRAEGSSILQEVFLPVVSNEQCQAKYNTRVTIWEKQMCAGGIKGSDSCGGDSGGPFILPVSTGIGGIKFFQLGVVSFGPIQCGVAGLPGVYSRISSYFEWLLNSMTP